MIAVDRLFHTDPSHGKKVNQEPPLYPLTMKSRPRSRWEGLHLPTPPFPQKALPQIFFFSLKYYNFKKGRFVASLVSIAKTLWQSTRFSRFYKQKWWQANVFLWQEFVFFHFYIKNLVEFSNFFGKAKKCVANLCFIEWIAFWGRYLSNKAVLNSCVKKNLLLSLCLGLRLYPGPCFWNNFATVARVVECLFVQPPVFWFLKLLSEPSFARFLHFRALFSRRLIQFWIDESCVMILFSRRLIQFLNDESCMR